MKKVISLQQPPASLSVRYDRLRPNFGTNFRHGARLKHARSHATSITANLGNIFSILHLNWQTCNRRERRYQILSIKLLDIRDSADINLTDERVPEKESDHSLDNNRNGNVDADGSPLDMEPMNAV